MDTFENSSIERDENGQFWVRQNGEIRCEAFRQAEDEDLEEMLGEGYIRIPHEFEGEPLYVQVLEEGYDSYDATATGLSLDDVRYHCRQIARNGIN